MLASVRRAAAALTLPPRASSIRSQSDAHEFVFASSAIRRGHPRADARESAAIGFCAGFCQAHQLGPGWCTEGHMIQSPHRQRRVRSAASGNRIWSLLVLSACSQAQESPSTPSAPVETARSSCPSPGLCRWRHGRHGTHQRGARGDAERGHRREIELGPGEPAETASDEPSGTCLQRSPSEVPMAPGQPVPPIGEPGFPAGSAASARAHGVRWPYHGPTRSFQRLSAARLRLGQRIVSGLYDLHGLTDSRDTNPGPCRWLARSSDAKSVIGPLIVVFPQGFAEGYWADTRDERGPARRR